MRGFFLSIQHARLILELYGSFLELYCIYFAGFLRKKNAENPKTLDTPAKN